MKPEFFPGQIIRLDVGYDGHVVHTTVLTTSVEYDMNDEGLITEDIIEETFDTPLFNGCHSLYDLEDIAHKRYNKKVNATLVYDPRTGFIDDPSA